MIIAGRCFWPNIRNILIKELFGSGTDFFMRGGLSLSLSLEVWLEQLFHRYLEVLETVY